MRWLILALALGTTFATLWRGIMLFITNLGTVRTASSSPFWWAVALCVASLFGFIGGVLAFNHKAVSLVFLLVATGMTFFGYSSNHVLVSAFAIISLLTFVYLIMYRRSRLRMDQYGFSSDRYGEEYDDEDEEDDEDETDDEEQNSIIKYKMPKRRSAYLASQDSDSLTIKHSHRQRETKVCLSCGMNIPISYKYCHSCGAELYTPPGIRVNEILEEQAEDREDEPFVIHGVETGTNKKNRAEYSVINEYESKEDDIEINENFINRMEEVEVVPVVRKTMGEEEADETQVSDDVPFKPLNIQPKKQRKPDSDISYQSFGRYTQSRKRRKVSLFQRVLLHLLVLSLIGVIGWFMYMGINKVPPPEIKDFPPRVIPEMEDDISRFTVTDDDQLVIAIPNQQTIPYLEVSTAKQVITTDSNVNLRENHTTSSRVITKLQSNIICNLLDQWKTDNASSLPAVDRNLTGVWYRVQSGNNTGWIYGQYALLLDGRAASLPAGYTDALLNSFGSNKEDIVEKLGAPRQQDRGGTTILEYPNLRITLSQNKVQSIQITGRGHSLINDLAVGISFDELSKLIGAPNKYSNSNRDEAFSYLETANRGIVVRREKDGRVRSINVGNI